MMSPIKRIFILFLQGLRRGARGDGRTLAWPLAHSLRLSPSLFRKIYETAFADDCHLDLSRIGQFILDPTGQLPRHERRLFVADFVMPNDDANFTSRLDGIGFLDPSKRDG